MISFQLDSGVHVYFTHFIYTATYAGLLEGDPQKTNWINDRAFERGTVCPQDWGTRKTLIIHPGDEAMKNYLPPSIYKVWLDSRERIDPNMDGSELVVIWFGEEPGKRSIQEIVESGVKGVDWKKHAEDIEY